MESPLLQKLLFLESIFDETDFIQGEAMFDSNTFPVTIKKSRGKYSVSLEERIVEIKLKKGQLDLEADPPIPKSQDKTELVFAALYLRKFLQEEQERAKEKEKSKPRARSKSNPIYDLLEGIPKEKILLFLQSYSRKDNHFAYKLQSNFITNYSAEDDKYETLLNKVIKPKSEKSPKLSQKDIQTFNQILETLNAQAQDLYSLQKFKELFDLIHACLKKIAYFEVVYQTQNPRVEKVLTGMLDMLYRMSKRDLAPAFNKKIVANLTEMSLLSYYITESLDNTIYPILFEHPLLDKDQATQILDNLVDKYNKIDKGQKGKTLLAALLISARYPVTIAQYHEVFESSDTIPALNTLLAMKFYTCVDKHVEILVKDEALVKDIALLQAERYLVEGDHERALEYYLVWVKYEPKLFELVKRIQRVNLEVLEANKAGLIKSVEQFSDEDKAYIFSGLDMEELLMDLITESQSIVLIKKYDRDLLEFDTEFVEAFYSQWTTNYLKEHFGQKSIDTIESLMIHIQSIGLTKFAKKLKTELKNQYNSRQSIADNISS